MEENTETDAGKSPESSGPNPQDNVLDQMSGVSPNATVEMDTPTPNTRPRHRRQEKVGLVVSDKMQKSVVVRVERQVKHRKYRRYIRRRTKFMAHDEIGAHTGDIVRIVETRPLSARKRWRVVEIVQKAR